MLAFEPLQCTETAKTQAKCCILRLDFYQNFTYPYFVEQSLRPLRTLRLNSFFNRKERKGRKKQLRLLFETCCFPAESFHLRSLVIPIVPVPIGNLDAERRQVGAFLFLHNSLLFWRAIVKADEM